jgi:hypothetical protein
MVSKFQISLARFVAVDLPEANELTVHVVAAMAQHEARLYLPVQRPHWRL